MACAKYSTQPTYIHPHINYTIIKFIANYIKGRKAYTTLRNKISTQRQFKTGVSQDGVLSPTLFNIYTSDTPTQTSLKLTTYADDITKTSTHNDINIANANIQSYLQEIHTWTQTNNLILIPDKITCTLFTPDPAEYSTTHIHNQHVLGRNTHTTHKGTPPTTRITDRKKTPHTPTTLHHITTKNSQT